MSLLELIGTAYVLTGALYWAYVLIKTRGYKHFVPTKEYPVLVRVGFFVGMCIGECLGFSFAVVLWPLLAYARGLK